MGTLDRVDVKLSKDVERQYAYDKERNILWVDTIYWSFECDVKKMDVKHKFHSNYMKFSYLSGSFYLSLKKIRPDIIKVELVREIADKEIDRGYDLQISFSVVASPCRRKISYIDCDINKALAYFYLHDFLSAYRRNNVWMIKCVVWMRENYALTQCMREYYRKEEQKQIWTEKLNEIYPPKNQYWQMALMMFSNSIVGFFLRQEDPFMELFMGRQDCKFADSKSVLLLRSFQYSEKLLSRRWNEIENEESLEDLGKLLGYIRNGEERFISNKDCILLYASAFFYGLSYLKRQCSDYIKMNLNFDDIGFFIDVVCISDMVNDRDLLNYASDWFLRNEQTVLNSVEWNNFKNLHYEHAQGFLFLFRRYEYDCQGEEEVEQYYCGLPPHRHLDSDSD